MMEQRHSGSGDNVAGNKTTVNNISVPKIIGFTLLGVSLFVVAYLLWPDPVYLSGYVYSSGGQPVEGATLAVGTPAGEAYEAVTDEKGHFVFERLTVRKAAASRLKVTASKDRELEAALDTLQRTENGLSIRLPAGTPPFRITYFNLGAHAIDKVLQGKLPKPLDKQLEKGSILVPNTVNDYYQKLLDQFGAPLNPDYYLTKPWDEMSEAERASTMSAGFGPGGTDMRFLPGKGRTFSTAMAADGELDEATARQLLEDHDVWQLVNPQFLDEETVLRSGGGTLALAWLDKPAWEALTEALIAARRASLRDYALAVYGPDYFTDNPGFLERFEAEYEIPLRREVAFWNELIGDELPAPLIRASMSRGQGCAGAGFFVNLTLPELYLQIAVFENFSEEPITIDTFVYRTLPEQDLRTEADIRAGLANASEQREPLLPLQQLAPGEALIIPQYFYAQTNREAYLDKERAAYRGVDNPDFLSDPDRTFPSYVFGPVFQIQEVLLRPELYAFREFDRDRLVLIDGIEAGSCPYAYTRSGPGASWFLEGHLIYGRRRQAWAGVDTLELRQFTGELLIREADPETSYLEYVYAIVDRADGSRQELWPDFTILRPDQPTYHVMEQGDSLLVRFPGFEARTGDRYRLVSAGYYLPYEPDFSYRLQAAAERAAE